MKIKTGGGNMDILNKFYSHQILNIIKEAWIRPGGIINMAFGMMKKGSLPVATPWGEQVGPDPPLEFRSLLRLAKIRWKIIFLYMGVSFMYIVTLTAHQQRKICRNPHFFWAGDATVLYNELVSNCTRLHSFFYLYTYMSMHISSFCKRND